jgi:fumarate reductase subunit D
MPDMANVHMAESAVKHAAENPQLEFLERVGYVARGVLYVVMGLLALGIALGVGGGKATDLSGSLVFLIGNPFGKLVLIATIIGLLAYSLWGFVRAIYDPLHRGRDASGVMARVGFVSSAVSYAAIALFALQILAGAGATSGDSYQKYATSILAHPLGGLITIVIGVVTLGIGVGQFVEAYRATFKQDLKGAEMTASEKSIAVGLGRFGMFARGVTFLVIGWFLIQAGIHHDAGQAHGFGGAFLFLLAQPYGRLLLGVIALGFVALGLHSLACARWIRLMGNTG